MGAETLNGIKLFDVPTPLEEECACGAIPQQISKLQYV